MDQIIELLPLLAVAAYYLLRGRQRAKAKQGPQPGAAAPPMEGTRGPTPFQSFMEQMEEALAEAAGEPEDQRGAPGERQAREPITVAVDRSTPATPLPAPPLGPSVPTPEFRAVPGSFSSPSPVDHERHGFGMGSPLSEERFERRRRPASDDARRGYDPHGLRPPPARRGRGGWSARLRDPEAARDAFVLQTIFGRRGGRHPAPDRTPGR